ncbi:MAG: hypothetical protein AB1631_27635 [Acidobacteriota bacterium]
MHLQTLHNNGVQWTALRAADKRERQSAGWLGRMSNIVWTEYLRYRAELRGFDLAKLEHIIRHSSERYLDTETRRNIVVGRHGKQLVMIPYEADEDTITPVTVHAITRQQIRLRLRTGRFTHE